MTEISLVLDLTNVMKNERKLTSAVEILTSTPCKEKLQRKKEIKEEQARKRQKKEANAKEKIEFGRENSTFSRKQ